MHLPDHQESLEIAGLVLEVDREDEVEPLVRAERLHQAILAPMACKDGAPLHRTPAEIAKCLFVECALTRILPRREVRFGWLMAQRSIELSGYRWQAKRGDQDRLRQFGEQLEGGLDPGRPLVEWMSERIKPGRGAQRTKARMIHIAGPMNPQPALDMGKLETAVDDGLNRFLKEERVDDVATTGRPNLYPVRGSTEEETRKLIEERLHTADGLVVLALEASWGAALEAEIGMRCTIPTLFLHPAERQPGKRARARLEAVEATVRAFDAEDESRTAREVADLVYSWLKTAYPEILAMQHRRTCNTQRLGRFLAALQTRRTQMGKLEERKALTASGLAEPRARALIEEPGQLSSASVAELLALSNAYRVPANVDGIDPEPPADRPPYLIEEELQWLAIVAEDDRISAAETIELVAAAQAEVALPGRRRKLFTGPRPWRLLRKRLHTEG